MLIIINEEAQWLIFQRYIMLDCRTRTITNTRQNEKVSLMFLLFNTRFN